LGTSGKFNPAKSEGLVKAKGKTEKKLRRMAFNKVSLAKNNQGFSIF
jgi:hypothetical protein